MKLIPLLALTVSISLNFVLGKALVSESSAASSPAVSLGEKQGATEAPGLKVGLPGSKGGPGLTETLAIKEVRLRAAELTRIVGNMDAAAIRQALLELSPPPRSPAKDKAISALYRRWGMIAPLEAFASIAQLPPSERRLLENDVLQGWAIADPDAAFEWAASHNPIVESAALGNPRFLDLQKALLDAERPNDLARLLGKMPDNNIKRVMALTLMKYLAGYDLDAAYAWTNGTHPVLEKSPLTAGVLGQALVEQGEADKAIDFALRLSAQDGRDVAIAAVFRSLGATWNLAATATWFSGEASRDAPPLLLTSFMSSYVPRFPEESLLLLDRAPNTATRERIVTTAVAQLGAVAPEEAFRWAAVGYPAVSAVRAGALEKQAVAWAQAVGSETVLRQVAAMGTLSDAEKQALTAKVESSHAVRK